ncbi:MAG: cation:proton antiporter [Chloroflexi bacterium]|nr:cation:proton antiporter [Chloroflexota bacterium]
MDESVLVRDFATIMAVAGIAIVVFQWLKQPPVLGYLIAGLIVGPYTLPLLNLPAPVTHTESIHLMAELGFIMLLFAIGLEFGWRRIRQLGLRVILIGTIEIIFMIALGYEVATLLGWTATEAIFLGAALSISSSAIIIKVLRDTGMLHERHGRLIVGILVVEDFAAVILLSLLSGVATTGTASFTEVMTLVARLGVFFVCALFMGALVAPRIVRFVARFRSREVMLIVSLAMCFGLALVGQQLHISAAVGAFIIGTVLGDTEYSEVLNNTIAPVRDIFSALFFISIGMLIELSVLGQFIVPALIIAGVFMAGKMFAATLGTFITGHDGKTSLGVGMGKPQMGEFSLAMAKVGADHAVVSAFLYPVVAAASAITSLLYPLVARSSTGVGNVLEQRSPRMLRQYVGSLSYILISTRTLFGMEGEVANVVRQAGRVMVVNIGVIVVTIGVGTFALSFAGDIARGLNLQQGIIGLVLSCIVVLLCVPPAVFIWRALHRLTDGLSSFILRGSLTNIYVMGRTGLHVILRNSVVILMVVMLAIWSLPFISQLVVLGSFSTPIAILFLLGIVALLWRVSFRIHRVMVSTFSRTFLGDENE